MGYGAGGDADEQPTDVYAALADLDSYHDPSPAPDPRYAVQPAPQPEYTADPGYPGYVAEPGYAADAGNAPGPGYPVAGRGYAYGGFGSPRSGSWSDASTENATEVFEAVGPGVPVGAAAYSPGGPAIPGPAIPGPAIPEQWSPDHHEQRFGYDEQRPWYADGPPSAPAYDERPAYDAGHQPVGYERDAFQQFAPADFGNVQPGEGLIDLSAPRALPATHRGRGGRHRRAVVVLAAAAVVVSGGAGYALLHNVGQQANSAQPATPTASPSADPSLDLGDPSTPRADPVSKSPSASASASPSATASATATPTRTATATPTRTTSPVIANPLTPTSSAAGSPSPRSSTTSAAPTAAPLSATYSFVDDGGDPVTGYAGTVRITNPRSTATSSWTVRLNVPDGGPVTVRGGNVVANGSGGTVTFTPASGSGSIGAHSSLSFTFDVGGSLDTLPSGCAVNGVACS
jgi:hypothetical protein